MRNVEPARGFRDLDAAAKRTKEDLLSSIRSVYLQRGFTEIETPVVEPIERLRDSDGGENTGMVFQVLRRGLTSADLAEAADLSELCDLGLRYDLTVPLARFVASNQGRLPEVFRSIQIGPVWRAERPQKGRYRQFTQCDIDIVGEASITAEIELILGTLAALAAIGLSGATVRLNDRRFLDALLADADVPVSLRPRTLIIVDKLDKVGLDGVRKAIAELLPPASATRLSSRLQRFAEGGEEPTIGSFVGGLGVPIDPDVIAANTTILETVRLVSGATSIRFDPTLVRGLGYYTGPVFEVEHPASKSSVAGGGRYDNMIGKFLGRSVPACGFSLGFDRLMELAPLRSEDANQRIAVVYEKHTSPSDLFTRQRDLLASGTSVRLVRAARNTRRLFEDLAADGFQWFQRIDDPVDTRRSVKREG